MRIKSELFRTLMLLLQVGKNDPVPLRNENSDFGRSAFEPVGQATEDRNKSRKGSR